eukprot:17892-Heterococcus_DN1.PRE.2
MRSCYRAKAAQTEQCGHPKCSELLHFSGHHSPAVAVAAIEVAPAVAVAVAPAAAVVDSGSQCCADVVDDVAGCNQGQQRHQLDYASSSSSSSCTAPATIVTVAILVHITGDIVCSLTSVTRFAVYVIACKLR